MRQIKYIVIHCTATDQKAKVSSIQRYWRENLKWKSPGYHKIVEPSGKVVTLATDDKICNGVAGHNSVCLHISYIGGRLKDDRTPQQKASIISEVKKWLQLYPNAEVLGHRDFAGVKKACPNFDVRTEYVSW